jgi:hypothetical protein
MVASDTKLGLVMGCLAIALLIAVIVLGNTNMDVERLRSQVDSLEEEVVRYQELDGQRLRILESCHRAIDEARRFAEIAIRSELELYDDAGRWVADAFRLGLQRDYDEIAYGLARTMEYNEDAFRLYASDIGSYDYLGWAGPLGSRNNPARTCLGVQDE